MQTFDIGIDLDGVGYNLQASLSPYARKHGYPLASESRWNRIDTETGLHGGFAAWGIEDYDQFLALCSEAVAEGVLYASGCPFPGFVSMMRALADGGHRLHIVTARTTDPDSRAAQATRSWLGEWTIPYHTLTFSPDKTQVRTDFFIEDSAFNYAALREAGKTVPYLISRPWNLPFEVENRISDLSEFTRAVQAEAEPQVEAASGSRRGRFLEPQLG